MATQARLNQEEVQRAFELEDHELETLKHLFNFVEEYLSEARADNPRFDLFKKVWDEYKLLLHGAMISIEAVRKSFGNDDADGDEIVMSDIRDIFLINSIMMQLGDVQWNRGIPTPGWFQGMQNKGFPQVQREALEKLKTIIASSINE